MVAYQRDLRNYACPIQKGVWHSDRHKGWAGGLKDLKLCVCVCTVCVCACACVCACVCVCLWVTVCGTMKHSWCNSIDTWRYICIVVVLLTAYCTVRNDDSFVFQNIDFEVEVQPNEKQAKELVVRVIDRDLGMVGLCPCHCLSVCLSFSISVFNRDLGMVGLCLPVTASVSVFLSFSVSVFLPICLFFQMAGMLQRDYLLLHHWSTIV